MPTTTTDGIPIPVATDKADVPGDIKRVVDAIMAKINDISGKNVTGWTNVPLAAAYSHNPTYPLQWRRINGLVELQGMAYGDYPGTIGTLPVGARPSKTMWFDFQAAAGNGTAGKGTIGTDGVIAFAPGYQSGSGGKVSYVITATFTAA